MYIPPHLRDIKLDYSYKTYTEKDCKVKTNSPYEVINDFSSIKRSNLVDKTPSTIQKYAIPPLLKKNSVMVRAPTGCGKTFCFLIPLIELIQYQKPVQILIITPTRELAEQIKEEGLKLIKNPKIRIESLYGKKKELYSYKNVDILVATPGRLLDCLERKKVVFNALENLVLDEADKLLEMGFEPALRSIHSYCPKETIVSLFSATFPVKLNRIIDEFLPKERIEVQVLNETQENIAQEVLWPKNKDETLFELLKPLNFSSNWKDKTVSDKVLIFVEKKVTADKLYNKINNRRFRAGVLHGDVDQSLRNSALKAFKGGYTPILVSTSVAARGIDVNDIALVINYDMPNDIEDYIHKIGRTGRQGKKGKSISFFSDDVTEEFKRKLIFVLKESKNDIPNFLYKNKRKYKNNEKVNYEKKNSDDEEIGLW